MFTPEAIICQCLFLTQLLDLRCLFIGLIPGLTSEILIEISTYLCELSVASVFFF